MQDTMPFVHSFLEDLVILLGTLNLKDLPLNKPTSDVCSPIQEIEHYLMDLDVLTKA